MASPTPSLSNVFNSLKKENRVNTSILRFAKKEVSFLFKAAPFGQLTPIIHEPSCSEMQELREFAIQGHADFLNLQQIRAGRLDSQVTLAEKPSKHGAKAKCIEIRLQENFI